MVDDAVLGFPLINEDVSYCPFFKVAIPGFSFVDSISDFPFDDDDDSCFIDDLTDRPLFRCSSCWKFLSSISGWFD